MAFIDGTSSVDFLDGTQFDDVVRGFDGNDTMRGLDGNDSLNGNEAEDYVNGNQGNDTVRGGRGNDTVLGGQGNDLIFGDLGNDFLYGDRGADTLEGGDGNDLFVIGVGNGGSTIQGADVITDFRGDGTGGTARDLIGLLRTDSNKSLTDLFNGLNITVVNGDTIIQDSATGEFLAVIDNFDRTLTSSDFNIAAPPQAIEPPSSTPTPSPAPSPTPTPAPTPSPTPTPGGTPTPFASVSVIATDSIAAESGTPPSDTGTFLVSRDNSVGNLTVNLAISGTATNTTDYATIPTTVTIPNGSTSVVVTVSPVDDAIVEPTETVILTIASGSGYSISSPNTAAVSILDNDVVVVPTASLSPTAANIAENGSTSTNITVNLASPAPVGGVLLTYSVGGTASNGTDYTTLTSSLLIVAGSSSGVISVAAIDDLFALEGNETVVLTLTNVPGYTISGVASTVTIADNDALTTASSTLPGTSGFGDQIIGSTGNDSLSGLAGSDTLVGGAGNDTLFGGAGNDLLTTGGATTFNTVIYAATTDGFDAFSDFLLAADRIAINDNAGGFTNFTGVAGATLDVSEYAEGATVVVASFLLVNTFGILSVTNGADVDIFYDPNNTVAGDEIALVKLQGRTLTSIDNTAFVLGAF